MASFSVTPIEPLEVEIRRVGQYAPAETVEEMISYLTSEQPDKTKPGFHSALARSIDAMVMAPPIRRFPPCVRRCRPCGWHAHPARRYGLHPKGDLIAVYCLLYLVAANCRNSTTLRPISASY